MMKRATIATSTAFPLALGAVLAAPVTATAQVAVRGRTVLTMAGPPIVDGVVVVTGGKIAAVGPTDSTPIPEGHRTLDAAVVTPGLIDAHSVVGLAGYYNQKHDQDQLEPSAPIQPELRALDAYNAREPLIEWVRSFGVTTLHTGHAPGELVSGQTFLVKTRGNTVEDALVEELATVTATLGRAARKRGKGKSPGTRGKMVAMLRAELIKARDYLEKREQDDPKKVPARNLKLEALGRVLRGTVPLMVTAHKAQDIANALRIAEEFDLRLILDGGAESYLLIDELLAANVPVIIHPAMKRSFGEMKNMSFETAATLRHVGVRVASQSGYESYVPKTRVVLFEAAIAAANGLSINEALATITIDAARILGIDDRVGSIEVGKDGDLALYDGDPFEYLTHCVGTIIEGEVVSDVLR